MIYRFEVPAAFGKIAVEEIEVEDAELIKQFMVQIAPVVTAQSLQTDLAPKDSAQRTVLWAMHLAAQYETLKTITAKDPARRDLQKEGGRAADLSGTGQEFPARTPYLPDLREDPGF